MDAAYLSAFSALAGSAIGALSSLATTWLTQNAQNRLAYLNQKRTKREALYTEFIDEASRLFLDALSHEMGDLSKMVPSTRSSAKFACLPRRRSSLGRRK